MTTRYRRVTQLRPQHLNGCINWQVRALLLSTAKRDNRRRTSTGERCNLLVGTVPKRMRSPVFLVLLFPDGRLPSRRWRPLLWMMFAVLAGWSAQQFQSGTIEDGGITNALEAAGVSYPNPLGVFPRRGPFSDFLGALVLLGLVAAALVVASVFARRRGAGAEVRKQLAWLGYVGLFVAIPVVPFLCYGLLVHGNVSPVLGVLFWGSSCWPPRSASRWPARWRC